MSAGHDHIIFFDGVCNLCNRSVQTVIKKDKKNKFKFSALQSDFAKRFFTEKKFFSQTDSIIYWNGKTFYAESAAVLKIAAQLSFPAPLLTAGWILPKFIRNAIYRFIARNRYKWFGKQESCMVPSEALKQKFL